jgi:hypothetical protein
MMPSNPFDPRVTFYLEHRQIIDEWIGLRREAAAAADTFFNSLRPDLEDLAKKLDGEPTFSPDLKGGYRKFKFHRPGWTSPDPSIEVAVAVEWPQNGGFWGIYSGVWVNRANGTIGSALHPFLKREIEPLDADKEYNKTSPWWPAYKYIVPNEDQFWVDPDRHREELVRGVEECWSKFWRAVDSAVEKWRAGIQVQSGTPPSDEAE